jgi:hypothetical protein
MVTYEAGVGKSKQSKGDLYDSQRTANGQQRLQTVATRALVKGGEMHSQQPSRGQGTVENVPPQNTLTTLSSHTLRERFPEKPRDLRLGLLIAQCKVLSPRAAGPTAGAVPGVSVYRREV